MPAYQHRTGLSFLQNQVGCILSLDPPLHAKPQPMQINTVKQMLTFPHQHRRHGQMHLIDDTSYKTLSNRSHTSADANILTTRGSLGLLQS